MMLYWNNPSDKLETHQKSWNFNEYFSTIKKSPLLSKTGWIYLIFSFGTPSDSNDISWDQAHQVFYENKSAFEYNMSRLQTLKTPIR